MFIRTRIIEAIYNRITKECLKHVTKRKLKCQFVSEM